MDRLPERRGITFPTGAPEVPTPGWCSGGLPAAVAAFRRGEPVLVVDDENRENEGDLVAAAELMTPELMAFIVRHTGGVVCVAMDAERLAALQLPQMVEDSEDPKGTAFTVSVDLRTGITTGISAADRAATVRALADPAHAAEDFVRPGHVFPLRARPGGVLERSGHTEAAVDLTRLAGLRSAAVISEVVNDDGTMARRADLQRFAVQHGLHLISVADLARHRRAVESTVRRAARTTLPTDHGTFQAYCYAGTGDPIEHMALVMGDVRDGEDVLARVHSECLTGDLFGSHRCDCGQQLDAALGRIAAAGRGILVYLRGHEGRGIGLANKLRAYELQAQGLDTLDANLALGLPVDLRRYDVAAQMLTDLGVRSVRLMTNNPDKSRDLAEHGIAVSSREPILVAPGPANVRYLRAKRDRLGHELGALGDEPDAGGALPAAAGPER
ncbi:bifunctional 3,4-dihydroxy-2-butanone-4-phosphate synthase/GTP cyclohydrolase II [Geodermatophilus ruber]|uniref:Riboflavin biosynthesis protein RibBA n=1 Tax=Geodermatophilus ruber TaxID=504800 RepID=A0A1I4HCT7_9ACTN|nr:bifunctional 3,4-dihydroxy-2-butanone-4-phosphate synthase/GTP cyclohydrolase II [Geodermatophilus ruber]SFL39427.1 3,4-dihydroxy 2-butanone 4-phosphate synthase / GTP cyclohydrolase II [Geodermatophilus ruber]